MTIGGVDSTQAKQIKPQGGQKVNKKTTENTIAYKEGATDNHSNMRLNFYDVNMIGNPTAIIFRTILNAMVSWTGASSCPEAIYPYQPIFNSLVSPEWRFGLIERFQFLNFWESVGSGMNNWGWIYPRIGYINSLSKYKAGATAAQRAASIVGTDQWWNLHVRWGLENTPSENGYLYFPIGEIDAGEQDVHPDKETEHEEMLEKLTPEEREAYVDKDQNKKGVFHWQMLYPEKDEKCHHFPTQNVKIDSDDGSFVWLLWRRYTCCSIEGNPLVQVKW